MLVKCIKLFPDARKVEHDQFLTIGKEYQVLVVSSDNSGTYYQIESDNDEQLIIVESVLFETISDYIPSNWTINCKVYDDKTSYLTLSPKSWDTASINFYEEITDLQYPFSYWRENQRSMPEVVRLYFKERDLIYKEEEKNKFKD